MKVAYRNLISRIKSDPAIEEISEKLFQLGHEHEIDNEIFDIEITPNRGDCLSVNGILRDLSVFYHLEDKPNEYQGDIPDLDFKFSNHARKACSRISFLKIEIDNAVTDYSELIENYFNDFDLNKNNFFTDISNYISYETGQPTHCYDLSKLKGEISLKTLECEDEFNTLFNKKIKLKKNDLVFVNANNNVINLAGIIGGLDTSCDKNTTSVLIECANFNPEFILGKSIKYDIQSEAAYKFERGVDSMSQINTLRRFIEIVKVHTKIKNIELYSEEFIEHEPVKLKYDNEFINRILGTDVSDEFAFNTLANLGIHICNGVISVPSHRNDLSTMNDIAEEIARVIGYDNIIQTEFKITDKKTNKYEHIEDLLRKHLVNNGFYEVINFPFTSSQDYSSIKIDNPLDKNKSFIRTTLKQSLIENYLYNQRRQKDSIKLFEISDIYSIDNGINKKSSIGLIASGRVGKNHRDFSKKISKKNINDILEEILENECCFEIEEIDSKTIGGKSKDPIIFVEIENITIKKDLSLPSNLPTDFKKYKPISEFPSSIRDISFSLTDFTKFDDLDNLIMNYESPLIKERFIFDFYNNLKTGEIKIGFRFAFQSSKKTVTDEDVDKVMNEIIKKSLTISSVSIPGLQYN